MENIVFLLVDDDPVVRKRYEYVVRKIEDSVVLHAENGKVALEKAAERKPDIIIMDLMMPVMNGVDASVRLKKKYPDCVIVVSTSLKKDRLEEEMKKAGAMLLVHKPVDNKLLLQTLEGFAEVFRHKKQFQGSVGFEWPMAELCREITRIKTEADADATIEKSASSGHAFTRLEQNLLKAGMREGMSSEEFLNIYEDSYGDDIVNLIEYIDDFGSLAQRFKQTPDLAYLSDLADVLEKISTVLNRLREMPSMVYAVNKLADSISSIDTFVEVDRANLPEVLDAVEMVIMEWKNKVLIDRSAYNINSASGQLMILSVRLEGALLQVT